MDEDPYSNAVYREVEARAATAVADTLTAVQAGVIKRRYRDNPHMADWNLSEVLAYALRHNHELGVTSIFTEAHAEAIGELRGALDTLLNTTHGDAWGDVAYGPGFLVGLSILVHALIGGDVPDLEAVAATATLAAGAWPRK